MQAAEITALITQFAPLSLQASWDHSGWQIGDDQQEVNQVLLCLDVTESIVEEAHAIGCDLIVSHHPLLFSGIRCINESTDIGRCVLKAIRYGIGIYAAHTNLDKAPCGPNYYIGHVLQLQRLRPLEELVPEADFGLLGELTEPLSCTSLLQQLKDLLCPNGLRYAGPTDRTIRRVALCSGSGASFITAAAQAGADAYICGDLKYHDYLHIPTGLLVADIGHYESEIITKQLFFELLSKKIPTFAIHFSQKECNPIHYL